jgi:hypothetical protein
MELGFCRRIESVVVVQVVIAVAEQHGSVAIIATSRLSQTGEAIYAVRILARFAMNYEISTPPKRKQCRILLPRRDYMP